jgi:hypothetical protein
MRQLTDHRKLKKKEDQSVNASILLRRWNKIIMEGRVRKGTRRERGKGSRLRYGKTQERSTESQEIEQKYEAVGDGELEVTTRKSQITGK